MKKLLIAVFALLFASLLASSCMSAGKMGCPTNTGYSNKPFRS